MNDSQSLLRNSLRANGAFSTLSGLCFLLGAGTIAPAIGLGDSRILLGLGVGLLGFAGYLAFVSSRETLDLSTAIAGDERIAVESKAGQDLRATARFLILERYAGNHSEASPLLSSEFVGVRRSGLCWVVVGVFAARTVWCKRCTTPA